MYWVFEKTKMNEKGPLFAHLKKTIYGGVNKLSSPTDQSFARRLPTQTIIF